MRAVPRSVAVLVLFGFVVLGGAVPAAGGGGGGGPCGGFAESSNVSMLDFCFSSVATFVDAGEEVSVRNDGLQRHDFTAVGGEFRSGPLDSGEEWSWTADLAPGVYRYYCTLHGNADGQGMAGVLVVDGAAGSARTVDSDVATSSESTNARVVASASRQVTPNDALAAVLAAGGASGEESDFGTATLAIAVIALAVAAAALGATVVAGVGLYRSRRVQ